jgi:RimJ/RimL family protein N-acetyltransferase
VRLDEIFAAIGSGRFPPADGSVRVVPSPTGLSDAVCAFTAHTVIAAPVAEEEVKAHLPAGDLGAPLEAAFLSWLGGHIGSSSGSLDVVLVSTERPGNHDPSLVPRADLSAHPRVARAMRYREEVIVFADALEHGVVIMGRGLGGRMEVSVEVSPSHWGKGLGRRLFRTARTLSPGGEPLFAQVAPGNAASLRAVLAAGYTPIGSEVLFPKNP